MKFPWIKNTAGVPSASLTMSIVAFSVVTLWLLVWLIATPFGATMPEFEAATAMAYLSPILALYFGRRYTATVKDGDKETETTMDAPPSD